MPGTPRNFALHALNATTLQATWLSPQEDNLNGVILGYRLVLGDLQSGESHTLNTSLLMHSWGGLHPHYSYSVSIQAATSVGHGPSQESRIHMPEAGKWLYNRLVIVHRNMLHKTASLYQKQPPGLYEPAYYNDIYISIDHSN